jgi:hypothetical protein
MLFILIAINSSVVCLFMFPCSGVYIARNWVWLSRNQHFSFLTAPHSDFQLLTGQAMAVVTSLQILVGWTGAEK